MAHRVQSSWIKNWLCDQVNRAVRCQVRAGGTTIYVHWILAPIRTIAHTHTVQIIITHLPQQIARRWNTRWNFDGAECDVCMVFVYKIVIQKCAVLVCVSTVECRCRVCSVHLHKYAVVCFLLRHSPLSICWNDVEGERKRNKNNNNFNKCTNVCTLYTAVASSPTKKNNNNCVWSNI